MQDWVTDDPTHFLRSMKTATQLHAEAFMTCTTCEQQPWFSFFFDGTGNNLSIDEPQKKLSNIARLYKGHVDESESPLINRFYYPGVGTPLDTSNPHWWEKIRDSEALGGGAGLGSDVRLMKAEADFEDSLRFNHKVSRIDIAVFGFSRGATLARAFVNRLLKKCAMKDGVPHWPCPSAVDGESAPLHIRFLGLFDTVESVGLPAHDLSGMGLQVPIQVERCLHFVAGHELRACFPLTPVRGSAGTYEEIVLPGMHSDVGGGYRPGEQARSDLLPRIALNRMRLEAAISGVPFIAPKLAAKKINDLFEYDEDVKTLFDEYTGTVGTTGTLEQQVFAHMCLYYGWLKARFGQRPSDIYKDASSTDPGIQAQLERIKQFHESMKIDIDTMNWRAYLTQLWNSDRGEYERTVSTAGGDAEMNKPLSDEQRGYWNAWLSPPALSSGLLRLFDQYVHDSRAGFLRIDSSGYLRPRQVIDVSGVHAPAAQTVTGPMPIAPTVGRQRTALSETVI
ncbi:T6SS phospholipase effector Tle1-like catalytic domain-containing protein [Paraburkholderia phenoliruptrix]|uniref:T6SS phospholipase effector Tle1-like catalytic domain-containing protein n=1 Tax=Paraburkholderia phenoliruptrix TaxID=252970 RepID=UPI003D965E48